jgi:hypothetical protein
MDVRTRRRIDGLWSRRLGTPVPGIGRVSVGSSGAEASGVLVLMRGFKLGMSDLMAVGGFLIVIFPIILQQLLKVARVAGLKRSPGAKQPAPSASTTPATQPVKPA